MTSNNRPLGNVQAIVLRSLTAWNNIEADRPYPGGGWIYDTHGGTVRVLGSLAKRGLAELRDNRRWYITEAGRDVLRQPKEGS